MTYKCVNHHASSLTVAEIFTLIIRITVNVLLVQIAYIKYFLNVRSKRTSAITITLFVLLCLK